MNILKRELKTGRKAFIFWSIGLFFIMFAGMAKYTGFSNDTSVAAIFDTFPKIVLAVFGIVGVDITSLGGFYAIVAYYGIICACVYAISLGCNAVNREAIDKTYEFIFTKPRSRAYILQMKMCSAFIYITIYSILSYLFSIAAVATLSIENNIAMPMILFNVAMWFVSMFFCSLAALICCFIKREEKGILYANLMFIATFVVGMVYDMLENGAIVQVFSPLKYFLPNEVLNGNLSLMYVGICIVGFFAFYALAIKLFCKKDLSA